MRLQRYIFSLLFPLSTPACSHSGGPDLETSVGTTTTGEPATSDVPVPTEASGDEPTTTGATYTGATDDDTDTSGSPADTTTDGSSPCGDGIVDPGEQCDDGVGNANHLFCTENCTINVCGDGKLLVNWEICDEGPANSDQWGSLCGTSCVPAPRCGDGKLQPEFESCDLGPDNGGTKGDEQGILCDGTCKAQRLRGFVTSAAFTGDLGGLFGADLKCQDAAAAAGLPEPKRFYALLSTGDIDARTRFKAVAPSMPYVLISGKKFADNFTALIEAGPLDEGISITETGAALFTKNVATNTAPGGDRFSPDQHCQGWTSADPAYQARAGVNAVPVDAPQWPEWQKTQWWISALGRQCSKEFHLYCLEI
ncbi:MAG TPA: hypothetical protein VGB85_13900 [Nannocystis sp.]